MNIAIIFAGGTGQRMNTKTKPKQFLELHGKPIIIYTLEQFEQHELIDGIVLVCVEGWLDYCEELIKKFNITKVRSIVQGGRTGMLSRYYGIRKAAELFEDDTICLIHDGVRPLIDQDTITKNIESVMINGSAITVSPAIETIAIKDKGNKVGQIIDRSHCQMAKAPQSFRLRELLEVHEKAINEGVVDCIDTAYLMQINGHPLFTVEGLSENIKITTPIDFYTFRAIIDARENSQIFGV